MEAHADHEEKKNLDLFPSMKKQYKDYEQRSEMITLTFFSRVSG